jgi:hypothetical protein
MRPRRVGENQRRNGKEQKNRASGCLDAQKMGKWLGQPSESCIIVPIFTHLLSF